MRLTRSQFKARVAEAMELVPAEFRPWLDNVEIVVEDWPDEETLRELDVAEDEPLYGVYLGTPVTERRPGDMRLPDRIVLYREELMEDFRDPAELRRQIAITLLHEIGHHLGLDEDRLADLGYE